jgi:hypothetical protein
MAEIIGIVEKKSWKRQTSFDLGCGDKKMAQDEMLISLRVNYLGRQNKRMLQDLALNLVLAVPRHHHAMSLGEERERP